MPVLFHLTEEFIFYEASVVIAVKSYEGVFYIFSLLFFLDPVAPAKEKLEYSEDN